MDVTDKEPGAVPAYDAIEDMARAYMRSRIILTAVELDVFSQVGEDGRSAEDVAGELGTDARATEMLLNALVAIGLLEKRKGRFFCSELSARHLTETSPEDARSAFMHLANLWTAWSMLTECVRRGTSRRVEETIARDESWTGAFIGAMQQFALSQAPAFVNAMDLTDTRTILDLGGGSGAYAITFARKDPSLSVTVFDLPAVVPLTAGYVREAGLSERIRIEAGDMCADDLGKDYDLVWISSICHMFGPEENIALFKKAYAATRPGGRIAVRDFVMSDDKTEPPFGAVFALNMLVVTARGSTYSRSEYSAWLRQAGFDEPEFIVVPDAGNAVVLIARKPKPASPG